MTLSVIIAWIYWKFHQTVSIFYHLQDSLLHTSNSVNVLSLTGYSARGVYSCILRIWAVEKVFYFLGSFGRVSSNLAIWQIIITVDLNIISFILGMWNSSKDDLELPNHLWKSFMEFSNLPKAVIFPNIETLYQPW